MVNQFSERTFSCDERCKCIHQTELKEQCLVRGIGGLEQHGYRTGETGK